MNKTHWSVAEAKAALSQVIDQTEAAPQVIENRGRPVAVVVSIADYESAVGPGAGSLRGSKWQKFLSRSSELRARGGAVIPPMRRALRPDPFRSIR